MQIGFLGLGAMGSRMAARLVAAGYEVAVWNRSPGREPKGAVQANSPRAAAEGAEMVISMVRDDAASGEVWLNAETGALAGMSAGALAIACSTLSPGHVKGLHAAALSRGVAFVEAPVAGSRPQAEAGALVFLAAGDAAAVERARPVLDAMGRAVHHLGGAGSGALAKLVVNTLLATEVAVLAEVMAMARRGALDHGRLLGALADTPVWNPALGGAAAAMQAGTFAPAFPIDLVVKDMALAVAAGGGPQMPMAAAAEAVFSRAARAGHGADNISGVVQLYI